MPEEDDDEDDDEGEVHNLEELVAKVPVSHQYLFAKQRHIPYLIVLCEAKVSQACRMIATVPVQYTRTLSTVYCSCMSPNPLW